MHERSWRYWCMWTRGNLTVSIFIFISPYRGQTPSHMNTRFPQFLHLPFFLSSPSLSAPRGKTSVKQYIHLPANIQMPAISVNLLGRSQSTEDVIVWRLNAYRRVRLALFAESYCRERCAHIWLFLISLSTPCQFDVSNSVIDISLYCLFFLSIIYLLGFLCFFFLVGWSKRVGNWTVKILLDWVHIFFFLFIHIFS